MTGGGGLWLNIPKVKTRGQNTDRQGFFETESGGLVRFWTWEQWLKILSIALGSVAAAWLTGCTSHTQTQYFAVKDPNTGAANYYRLSIKGSGNLTKYNLQAGYYSSAAVDILRGRMPDVPELDLPIGRAKTYESLLDHIDKALLQEAKQIAPITSPKVAADSLRKRVEDARIEQAMFQAEQDTTGKGLAVATNRIAQAEDSVNKAQKQRDASDAAAKTASQFLIRAKTNSKEAHTAMTNLVAAVSRLQEATNRVNQALTNTNPSDAAQTVTNLSATIADIRNATNGLGGNIVFSNMPDITLDMGKIDALVAAIQSVTNGLSQATEAREAATVSAMSLLATKIAAVQIANKALGENLTKANDMNLAKGEEATTARVADLKLETKGLADAESELADANHLKVSLDAKLVLLRTRIQFATQSETNASECILRLETKYPDSALGLDLLDTSASGLAAKLADPDAFGTKYIKLSRLAWLSSLSSEDVAAVGMNQTLDPFHFRKLVFWTKSTSWNLDQAAGDIDAIRGQVVEIGRSYKKIGQERETAHAQAQADQVARANAALEALKRMAKDGTDLGVITNLVKILVPKMDSPAQKQTSQESQ